MVVVVVAVVGEVEVEEEGVAAALGVALALAVLRPSRQRAGGQQGAVGSLSHLHHQRSPPRQHHQST